MKTPPLRFALSVFISKTIFKVIRCLGSGGSSLPGLICLKIDPEALSHFAEQCTNEVILVAGTNGKTTTCRIASQLLKDQIIHNKSGSNMLRGHLSAFIENSNWFGKISSKTALLEVDEAILPQLLKKIKPTKIILLNLFRDQLDRYGEIDTIAHNWEKALSKNLPPNCVLYINADDPNLAYIGKKINHRYTIYWGINAPEIGTEMETSTIDANLSPQSGKPLIYSTYYLSHLGDYTEEDGSFKRPILNIQATNCQINENNTQFDFKFNNDQSIQNIIINLPGVYNLYNTLAALCLTSNNTNNDDTSKIEIKNKLANITSAFGRFETIEIGNNQYILCLIKNPAGANEVIKTIGKNPKIKLIILANDNFADGLDVSWYWDCTFEKISEQIDNLICGGSRAQDMALRLKYAGYNKEIKIENNILHIIQELPNIPNSKEPTFILSTYTPTLEVQKILKQMKIKQGYWKE